jgi:hypothetical protein
MVTMGLVFGTICPLMNVVVLWNIFAQRLVYGYLMTCAECRKNDLGGEAFVLQIKQVSQSLLIYIVLMVGILAGRAESSYPSSIAGLTFIYWFARYEIMWDKEWERLCLHEGMIDNKVDDDSHLTKRGTIMGPYSQHLHSVYTLPFAEGAEKKWVENYLQSRRPE